MKRISLILNFSALALAFIACFSSCKPKDTDNTLVGNWVLRTRYEFPGTPRGGAVCFTIGDKAYVGLGYNGKNYPKDFFALDLNGETWRRVADFPGKGRERAIAFSAAGKGYVGLGYNRDDQVISSTGKKTGLKYGANDFYAYDPAKNEWTRMADFTGTPRYDAIGFALKDKGYVGTGQDSSNYYCSDMFKYDPATNAWSVEKNYPGGKKNSAFALSTGDVAYAGGGFNNKISNADFWKFDGTDWTSLRPKTDVSHWSSYVAAVNRGDANIFAISGKIYIVNGILSGGSIARSCYEWNPSDDVWKEKTGFSRSPRHLAVSFTIGNRTFVCAGQNANSFWDDTSEFFPTEKDDTND